MRSYTPSWCTHPPLPETRLTLLTVTSDNCRPQPVCMYPNSSSSCTQVCAETHAEFEKLDILEKELEENTTILKPQRLCQPGEVSRGIRVKFAQARRTPCPSFAYKALNNKDTSHIKH